MSGTKGWGQRVGGRAEPLKYYNTTYYNTIQYNTIQYKIHIRVQNKRRAIHAMQNSMLTAASLMAKLNPSAGNSMNNNIRTAGHFTRIGASTLAVSRP